MAECGFEVIPEHKKDFLQDHQLTCQSMYVAVLLTSIKKATKKFSPDVFGCITVVYEFEQTL